MNSLAKHCDRSKIPFFKCKEALLVTCNVVFPCKIVFSHFKSNHCSAVAYLLRNELGGFFFGDQFFLTVA